MVYSTTYIGSILRLGGLGGFNIRGGDWRARLDLGYVHWETGFCVGEVSLDFAVSGHASWLQVQGLRSEA